MKKSQRNYVHLFTFSALIGMCAGLSGCEEFDDLVPGFTTGVSSGLFPGSSHGGSGGHGPGSSHGGSGGHGPGSSHGGSGGHGPGSSHGGSGQGSVDSTGSDAPVVTHEQRHAVVKNWDLDRGYIPEIEGLVRFFQDQITGKIRAMVTLSKCSQGHYEVDIRVAGRCGLTFNDTVQRWDPIGFGRHKLPDGSTHHGGVIGEVGCAVADYPDTLVSGSPYWKLDGSMFDPNRRTVVLRDPNTGRDVACGEIYAGSPEQ